MKKTYITPSVNTMHVTVEQPILAGSAGSTDRNTTTGSGDGTTPSGSVDKYDGSEDIDQRSAGYTGGWDYDDWD